ncbi:MAG: hypothetical protein ACOY40_09645 [Bacillota bacterium]
MNDNVVVRVFPRLNCCVPDFTGKNAALARVLHQMRQEVGDLAKIEVIPSVTRAERLIYYDQMIDALLAGGHALPFAGDAGQWNALRSELGFPGAGLFSSPGDPQRFWEISFFLFSVTPVIGIDGRAVFVGEVPSAARLSEAIRIRRAGR